jgi:hypothetical protein
LGFSSEGASLQVQISTGNVVGQIFQQDTILFYPTQLGFSLQEELRVSAQILGGP